MQPPANCTRKASPFSARSTTSTALRPRSTIWGILQPTAASTNRRALHEESLAVRRKLGDAGQIAVSLNNLGEVLRWQGRFAEARRLFEEALELCWELEHWWGIALLCYNLGLVALYQHDLDQVQACFEESLALFGDINARQGIGLAKSGLARLASARGEIAQAYAPFAESLPMFVQSGDKRNVAEALEEIAFLHIQEARLEQAARLQGAAARVREDVGLPLAPIDQPRRASEAATVRQQIGTDVYVAAWNAGHALSVEQAMAEALQTYDGLSRAVG